jgi:membrane protein insertase, YidC/Oxa1 family, C-terminal domain
MIDIIATPLGWIMRSIYALVHNYGVTIILFAIITKILFLPLNVWVQKNSIKMVKLQPLVNEISAKFVGDRDKIAEEQFALYKKEKYHPTLGIIPMLIQIPLIIGLINVVYNPFKFLFNFSYSTIAKLTEIACTSLDVPTLGAAGQLTLAQMILNPNTNTPFIIASQQDNLLPVALAKIATLDFSFFGIDLSVTPSISEHSNLLLIPLIAGGSSLLLSVMQNKLNVLQKEQSKLGQWGMAIFLTAFSLFFAFLVPAAIGLYWAVGNVVAIGIMLFTNFILPPEKHIDYSALEKSKHLLKKAQQAQKNLSPTKEQKRRAKNDYKRFFDIENESKSLVFYSSAKGTYKYFRGIIENILFNTDITIHYVASDIDDLSFPSNVTNHPHLVSYYIEGNNLIYFFMKLDADIVIMTMPELGQYYYKRSIVRKDIEYIYMFHGVASSNLLLKKGALDYYDTIFCVGPNQMEELRAEETLRNISSRNLVKGGYSLIDETIKAYELIEKKENYIPEIVIAPSWHDGNICETCIDELVDSLVGNGWHITLRPHPEFVKRYLSKMQDIIERIGNKYGDEFIIETDYSTNTSIFSADAIITDWSTICYEFSFSTKRPTCFINTPMKIMNPDYKELDIVPLDIKVRDDMGKSVDIENINTTNVIIADFLENKDNYRKRIEKVMEYAIYNVGKSADVEANYIINQINKYSKNRLEDA